MDWKLNRHFFIKKTNYFQVDRRHTFWAVENTRAIRKHKRGVAHLKSEPILFPCSGVPGSGHKWCPWYTPTWVTTMQKKEHTQKGITPHTANWKSDTAGKCANTEVYKNFNFNTVRRLHVFLTNKAIEWTWFALQTKKASTTSPWHKHTLQNNDYCLA